MISDKINKLLIVSHVRHYYYRGDLYAYAPYAEEIDIWAGLFPQVLIASPCHFSLPSSDTKKFNNHNLSIIPIVETGGNGVYQKIKQIILVPFVAIKLAASMKSVDAVHVRCPGNLGLLGVLLAPLFSSYRIAKYAGQWNGFPEEVLTTRLQRKLLCSSWWNAPVTVYGDWADQPKHIIPFFTSLLSDDLIQRAQLAAHNRVMHNPLRIIYVGRLSRPKNVNTVIKALRHIQEKNISFECKIIGDGDERDNLIAECSALGISANVQFLGSLPFTDVINYYEWADILVLVSESEGWPKAITEGMAFGLVCIGSNRGLVPQILSDGRGYTIEPGNDIQLADTFVAIASSMRNYSEISKQSAEWSQQYSLKKLKQSLRTLIIRAWNLPQDALSQNDEK